MILQIFPKVYMYTGESQPMTEKDGRNKYSIWSVNVSKKQAWQLAYKKSDLILYALKNNHFVI